MKNYNEMTAADIRVIAREHGMPGAWKATKSQMIEFLSNLDLDEEPETVEEIEKIEDITETHEDDLESIETESHETTQDEPKNEPEINEDTSEHAAAKNNIENAYNWIMGGMENAVSDGETTADEFNDWIENEAFDEILTEATTTRYGDGISSGNAPSCMKKVTKEFCARYLLSLFKADDYDINPEIKPAQKGHATPKRGALLAFNGKEQNICAWAKELGISANTLYGRIYKMGWTIEKAFTTPARSK